MANSIKKCPRVGTWVELTAGSTPATFNFDNQGPASIYVQYASSAPAATERGLLFKPGQGDRPSTMTRAWARTEFAQAEGGSDADVFVQVT